MEIAEAATEASTPSTGGEKDDDDESDSPATPTPTGSGLPPIPPLEGASAGNANASTLPDTTPFNLIRWCLKSVGSHSHYGIRGTVFTVLGLLSRTTQGRQTLNKFKWESAPVDYHSRYVPLPFCPCLLSYYGHRKYDVYTNMFSFSFSSYNYYPLATIYLSPSLSW